MTAKKKEKIATEIMYFLVATEAMNACCIYFNGKCYCEGTPHNGRYPVLDKQAIQSKYGVEYTIYTVGDINPKDYFEFTSDIVSISTEGLLYDILNYDECPDILDGFNAILDKYGLYYEMGNSWNFGLYEK